MIIEMLEHLHTYRVNQHDSYARRLDVDEVIARSGPPLAVVGDSRLPLWRRLLRWLKGVRG